MKRFISIVMAAMIMLTVTSCGSADETASGSDKTASSAVDNKGTAEQGVLKPYTESEEKKVNIMLLGDSLTQGTSGSSGYRSYLCDMLLDDGYKFSFVGPWQIEPAFMHAGYRSHAGVGGYRMSGIKNDMNTFMSFDCDIIVMMIGTNDMNSGSAEELTKQYSELVDMITKAKPNVHLFCASAPPTSFASGSYTDKHVAFNNGVKSVCAAKTKEGFKVTWLDMSPANSGITNSDLNPEDHVHPVDSGWEKFAKTIHKTIKSAMDEVSAEKGIK